jgi:hypothetical protein
MSKKNNYDCSKTFLSWDADKDLKEIEWDFSDGGQPTERWFYLTIDDNRTLRERVRDDVYAQMDHIGRDIMPVTLALNGLTEQQKTLSTWRILEQERAHYL